MNARQLLDKLLTAEKVQDIKAAITEYRENVGVGVEPFGRRENNRGAIEVATDPARSAIERVTNAHDALLEYEHKLHGGTPVCRSPREAAAAWLEVPTKGGLSSLTQEERRKLAAKTVLRLDPGEGWQSRLLTVTDMGIGIGPSQMEGTILSLNESNKIQKHYLAGTYGQGGASTLAFSRYVVIASRADGGDTIAFTVVWYEDLPADKFKTGRYVYLVENGAVPVAIAGQSDLEHGTIIRHFGFDLTSYNASIGPKSLYGALQRILFDPVAPIRFENKVAGWNRTIKGARNALNGAVDQGDDTSQGPALDHHLPTFNVSLGDHGEIGIEYWVLSRSEKDGKPSTNKPSRGFVDDTKPIILTHNGQNQGEMSGRLIKKDADFPYLQAQGRLIVHINCDRLSASAKRLLFSSTREQWREGFIQKAIQQEIINLLRSDDELKRLDQMARDQSLKDKDDAAERQIQRQVARLLSFVGPAVAEVGGSKAESGGAPTGKKGGGEKRVPEPIETSDPPTFIRIVADGDDSIEFYAGQRRYVRVETDANSDYHDPDDPSKNRLNIIVGDALEVFGTSPIRSGRFRIGIRAKTELAVGSKGSLRVELYRPGASTLSDERSYEIVDLPKPKEGTNKANVPQFKLIPVEGPDDENWTYVAGDNSDRDVARHASGSEMSGHILYVYYSKLFPRYVAERQRLVHQNPILVESFQRRYEIWIAVHALLKYQDDNEASNENTLEEHELAELDRQERCRLASIAAMVAAQEVKHGMSLDEDAAAA